MTKITILPPSPLGGVKGQIYKFRNSSVNCQYAAAWKQIFCPQTPTLPLTLGLGSKGQNLTSSEHCDVAYQIKELHKCSNMLANIYPQTTPSPPTLGKGSVGVRDGLSLNGMDACLCTLKYIQYRKKLVSTM